MTASLLCYGPQDPVFIVVFQKSQQEASANNTETPAVDGDILYRSCDSNGNADGFHIRSGGGRKKTDNRSPTVLTRTAEFRTRPALHIQSNFVHA